MIEPENRLPLEEWSSGQNVWLVDLIAPFATVQSRQREIMIADLIAKPPRDTPFRFHQTNPATGRRPVQAVVADAGDKLAEVIKAATKQGDGTRP